MRLGKPDESGVTITRKHAKKMVKRYKRDFIDKGIAYGHLEHDEGDDYLNLNLVSHRILHLQVRKKGVIAKLILLDTPKGRIAKELYRTGGRCQASVYVLRKISEPGKLDNPLITKIKCFDLVAVSSDKNNWLERL